tara:strand:- start:66 stop:689 length:624 start_codon:yes stop_codon:yes gene_type:complete
MNKKKLIIFDVDGVLFDSLKNMETAWKYTTNKFHINVGFDNYVKYLGLPFIAILQNLGINSKKKEIQKYYQLISEKNLNLITPFKKTQKIIGLLNKYQIKKAICTSKDFQRTKKILNKYNLKFDAIEADINNQKKGKPHPNKVLSILDKLKIDKKYSVYIGDMYIDYLTAKNAKIDYLHAGWGYSKINQNVTILNSIDEVLDYVEMK